MKRAESFVALRAVSKHYGPVKAVDRVSFDIAQGEFFSLLGPSGCGKTTLLRLLGGFETPTDGEILIDGQPMSGVPANRRPTNMVFQNYAIFPHLSVRENIAFGLDRRTLGERKVEAEVEQALELIKLPGYGERRPHQLSGGQRQRVAIGRAIVKEPRAFLFDEPLSNLDASLRSRTRVELSRLHQRMEATMIFVTHDQIEAMTMATRIVVMNKGRIEQVGTPLGIYRRPATHFVAGFIGSPAMNFLKVEPAPPRDGMVIVRLSDGATIETGIPESQLGNSRPVELGIRAEHVISGSGIPAVVDVVERLGDRTLVYTRLRDGTGLVYQDEGDSSVRVGESVALSFRRPFIHLFDADGHAHQSLELPTEVSHG
jgi:multiple sugar transport system ATP-binding protein